VQVTEQPIRIIRYFCSARDDSDNRPDCETVIRSIIGQLSWRPDYSVAQSTSDLYNQKIKRPGPTDKLSLDEWIDVLVGLLVESYRLSGKVVILVDALDAFINHSEAEDFLFRMNTILRNNSNVFFLFSSHQTVRVASQIDASYLQTFTMDMIKTDPDMSKFIDTEIQARREANNRTKERDSALDSIFCMWFSHDWCIITLTLMIM
jgi:hypothetical protein